MGVFIDKKGRYKLDGFNEEDLIKWNRMENRLDEIFNTAMRVY